MASASYSINLYSYINNSSFILFIKYLQVIVHFSAYWCVPSIAMDPFFEELASTYQDVLCLKVDVDEVKVFFIVYGGEGLPFSFVFFKNYLFHIPLSMQHRHLKLKACLVSDMF